MAFWLLATIALYGCSERPVPYESRFNDVITISFPEGHAFSESRFSDPIDKHLRQNEIGFFSGVLGGDRGIDFISIDTDFDLVNETSLVEGWIADKIIPKDVKVTYERDPYGREDQSSH